MSLNVNNWVKKVGDLIEWVARVATPILMLVFVGYQIKISDRQIDISNMQFELNRKARAPIFDVSRDPPFIAGNEALAEYFEIRNISGYIEIAEEDILDKHYVDIYFFEQCSNINEIDFSKKAPDRFIRMSFDEPRRKIKIIRNNGYLVGPEKRNQMIWFEQRH